MPSTTPSFYNSGGKIQGVILAPRLNNNSPSGTDFAAGGTFVDKIIDSKTYVVNVGISTVDHNYARAGLSQQGKRIAPLSNRDSLDSMLSKRLMLQNSVLMLELQHKLPYTREAVKLPNL